MAEGTIPSSFCFLIISTWMKEGKGALRCEIINCLEKHETFGNLVGKGMVMMRI